jgi:capsular polysaccharide biosynthesis protein
LLILVVGGIFAAAGAGAVLLQKPSYASTAHLLIDQPGAISYSFNEGIISKLAAIRLKYVGLATSDRVDAMAASDLSVPEYVVTNAISASAPADSLLLQVTAHADNAEAAEKIANATAEVIIKFAAQEQDLPSIPPERRFVFELVNKAPPGFKVAPTTRRMGAVGAIAGLLAMAATYVLIRLRAPSRPST